MGGRLPEALTPPPKGLVGRGYRFDDGRTGFIVGFRVERKTFWGVFGKCFGPNLSV